MILRLYILIVIFVLSLPGFSICKEYQLEYLKKKQNSFNKLKITGASLTVAGGVFLIGGIAVLANTESDLDISSQPHSIDVNEQGDGTGALGVLITVAGIGMGVAGIVLYSISKRKLLKYEKLIQEKEQSLSFKFTGDKISLCYNF